MSEFWASLRYLIRAKKCWRWPKRSKVLIFDACNQAVLMEYLQQWNPEVLHVRGEQVNILVLLNSLFKNGKRSTTYVDCFIDRVRPRLVVTFIDNSVGFLSIRRRHPEVKTLFVQNGWRSYHADIFETLDKLDSERRSELRVDYMLSFGSVVGGEYSRYVSGAVVPIGSLKNNRVPQNQSTDRHVLAFISQWDKEGVSLAQRFFSQEEFFGQADRYVLTCLAQYAECNNKRLVIIPRNQTGSDLRALEESYFHRILSKPPLFLDNDGLYPSYQAIDASTVVVTIDSTLGYESIARGKRTAIFSIRSAMLNVPGLTFGWPGVFPADGPYWTNQVDGRRFVQILDYLFQIDEMQWRADLETAKFSSLMHFDPGNLRLQSILAEELGAVSTS